MLSLIIFILILSALVLIHEFGHFITAKKMGIYVEEFGLGIPPKVWGKKIGETEYSLNLLPFGGFVKLKGEDVEEVADNDLEDPRSFLSKKPLQRILVLVSGVIMNVAFGVFLFYVFLVAKGFSSSHMPLMFDHNFRFGEVEKINTVIFALDEKSPFMDERFSVIPGEAIISIDSTRVNDIEDVKAAVFGKEDIPIPVTVRDLQGDGSEREIIVTPYSEDGGPAVLGVFLGSSAQIAYRTPIQKIFSGFMHSYNIFAYSMETLGKIVGFSITERTAEPLAETVAGPIGIYAIVEDVVATSAADTTLTLIDLTALISISLAFLNILPLPALDGGRVVFILAEVIRGKRISPRIEASVHKAGIIFLLSFLVLITVRDISRFFL